MAGNSRRQRCSLFSIPEKAQCNQGDALQLHLHSVKLTGSQNKDSWSTGSGGPLVEHLDACMLKCSDLPVYAVVPMESRTHAVVTWLYKSC